jgi:hypothetical protein
MAIVYQKTSSNELAVVLKLGGANYFSAISLLFHVPHAATVKNG